MNLGEKILEKVYEEQADFRRNLIVNYAPSGIYEKAYEICYKNEIVCILESTEFTDEVYKKLLKQDNILDYLYGEWMKADCSVCEMLEDVIERVVK